MAFDGTGSSDPDADALYRALARATVDVARAAGVREQTHLDAIATLLD